jgi:hypothetical protein
MTEAQIIAKEFEHVRCRNAATGAKAVRRIQLVASPELADEGGFWRGDRAVDERPIEGSAAA